MLFFSSNEQVAMPKTSGIPKSILADINKLKTRLTTLEKNHSSLIKDFKSTIKSHSEMLKKQQSTIAQQETTIAQLSKKSVKKEKRKPSEYHLFNSTDRPRLAITDTTILAIQPPSGDLMRGCISSCHRLTPFFWNRDPTEL